MITKVTKMQKPGSSELKPVTRIQDMYETKQLLAKMIHLASTGYGKLSGRQDPLKRKIEEFLDGKRPAKIGGREYYYQDLLDLIFE